MYNYVYKYKHTHTHIESGHRHALTRSFAASLLLLLRLFEFLLQAHQPLHLPVELSDQCYRSRQTWSTKGSMTNRAPDFPPPNITPAKRLVQLGQNVMLETTRRGNKGNRDQKTLTEGS